MNESSKGAHGLAARVLRASIAVGIAHIVFKFAGALQSIAAVHLFEEHVYDAVYAGAFENIIFALFLIGEEVIGPTFLPVFMRQLDLKSEKEAWHFASAVLTLHFVLLIPAVAFLMMYPDLTVQLLTKWDPASPENAERFRLASRSVFMLAPSLFGLSLASTTYMLLNGYKRFFAAAFGDAVWKLCALASMILGMGMLGFDHRALLTGLLIGSLLKLATHLLALRKEWQFIHLNFHWFSKPVRAMMWLAVPLIAGIIIAKYRDIYNNMYILSGLEDGMMRANSAGRKLYTTIGFLVPYAISIAMFPFFCDMVDRDDKVEFGNVLTTSTRIALAFFIPVCIVLATASEPIISLLYRNETFGQESIHWTSVSMACYTLVLPAAAVEYLLMQAFFANRKMMSVVIIGLLFSLFSVFISWLGAAILGAKGATMLGFIALGFTISRTLKSACMIAILKRRIPFLPLAETIGFLLRAIFLGLACGVACHFGASFFRDFVDSDSRTILLSDLALRGLIAVIVFFGISWLLRLKEPFTMLTWALKRFKRS